MRVLQGKFRVKTGDVAVVCFASGIYTQVIPQFRILFAKHSPRVDVFVFTEESEIQSPSHKENPYAFKVYAVEAMRRAGYRFVLWCDSILKPTRPIEEILPEVAQTGVYLAQDGWKTGQYANDRALEYFGVSRDEAMNISSIWACFMGFDFSNPIAHDFFARWKKACTDGIFRGKWNNKDQSESQDPRCKGHRHDQSCAELIAYKMNLPLSRPVLSHIPEYDHRYFTGREW
jgi:hypothetical protein